MFYIRSFGVAEPRPLDFNARITQTSLSLNFSSDMLSFSIAVSPDKQCFGVLGLFLDVLCDAQFVLLADISKPQSIKEFFGR